MDLSWAISALEQYGLLGIFLVIALEYACLPMPSEVLLPLSGLAAAAAGIPLALVVAVSVLAGLLGSAACYAIGAIGGRPLLNRMLRRFPKALAALESTSRWQADTGGLSVMVARVIPFCRTWISFAAGLARQPFGWFALYSSIGIIVWNSLLIFSGYYLFLSGVAIQASGSLWLLPVCGFGLTALAFVIRHFIKKRRRQAASES